MKRLALIAALALFMPASALADSCPILMSEIDEAMQVASLSDGDRARVQELRAQGQVQHEAGDHAASMQSLGEAKRILGL